MANGDHDFTAGEILTAGNVDDYLMLQAVQKFATSAARDAALTSRKREGMVTYQDDANSLTAYSGSAWSTVGPVHGALTAWTPTLTQSGSVGVTISYAKYIRIGRLIQGWFNLAVTGSGTANNNIVVGGIPFTAATSGIFIGSGFLVDTSVTEYRGAVLYLASTTTLNLYFGGLSSVTAPLGGTGSPFTAALASGDGVWGSFAYEAAADA